MYVNVEATERGMSLATDMEFRSLIAHPSSSRTLYVASKAGIFVTTNDGTNWRSFDSGLPKVEIKNIVTQTD